MFFKLPFVSLLLVFTTATAHAQEWLIHKILNEKWLEKNYPMLDNSFYEIVTLGTNSPGLEDFNLKGQVNTVSTVRYHLKTDSTMGVFLRETLQFNADGFLILKESAVTDGFGITENYHDYYTYQDKKLAIHISQHIDRDSIMTQVMDFYNADGYLEKQVESFACVDELLNERYPQIKVITYDSSYQSGYVCQYPVSKPVIAGRRDSFEFDFDEQGRYISPVVKFIRFDSLNRPVYYLIDNGHGQNSALYITVTTKFNEQGDIIEQSVNDMTTRNAMWSWSSSYMAEYRYSAEGLVVEKKYTKKNLSPDGFSWSDLLANGTSGDNPEEHSKYAIIETYEYEFDEHGNWISQRIVKNKSKVLIKRQISYY